MKKAILLLLLAIAFGCDKNDDNNPSTNPIDQLPPATQVGANKVGCLLDGKVHLPGSAPLSTNCFYQFNNGEYYFVMAFGNRNSNSVNIDIGIGTRKLQIQQNTTYDLVELSDNNAYGGYNYGINSSYTRQIHTGKLTITKLTDQFVSGTFWFDVEDTNGVVHQIREGRFDMEYTNLTLK